MLIANVSHVTPVMWLITFQIKRGNYCHLNWIFSYCFYENRWQHQRIIITAVHQPTWWGTRGILFNYWQSVVNFSFLESLPLSLLTPSPIRNIKTRSRKKKKKQSWFLSKWPEKVHTNGWNSLAERMKRGKCSLLHFHCGKRTFHTHLWSGKSTIPWHCKHFLHYWVFDYLHSNLLTDDPHYPSGWQVRHILHQMKCTWRQFQQRSCKTETTPGFVNLLPCC